MYSDHLPTISRQLKLITMFLLRCFLLLFISVGGVFGISYGEKCDPSNPDHCRTVDGLTCAQNGTEYICACLRPGEMEHIPETGRCDVLLGFNCSAVDSNGDKVLMNCIDIHSRCDDYADFVCKCDEIYANSEGKCVASIGAECSAESPCFVGEGGVCQFGRCGCPKLSLQYFDVEKRRCYSLMGVECTPGDEEGECDLEKAQCTPDRLSRSGHSCACDSSKGFVSDYWLGCKKGHMETCGYLEGVGYDPVECSEYSGLLCEKGECMCKYGAEQTWDEERGACVGIEGGGCGMYEEFQFDLCEDGLTCVMDPAGPKDMGVCLRS